MTSSPFFLTSVHLNTGAPPADPPLVVEIVYLTNTVNTTTPAIPMPTTVDAGDLILAVLATDGNPTITGTPFTAVFDQVTGTNVKLNVWAKIADGTEDGTTVNFATSANENTAAMVYRIIGWGGTIATHIVAGTAVETSTGTTIDPPNLTSGFGAVPTLWIAASACSQVTTPSTLPSGYSVSPQSVIYAGGVASTGQCSIASGWKQATAASEDPGTFSYTATIGAIANTFAIRGTT